MESDTARGNSAGAIDQPDAEDDLYGDLNAPQIPEGASAEAINEIVRSTESDVDQKKKTLQKARLVASLKFQESRRLELAAEQLEKVEQKAQRNYGKAPSNRKASAQAVLKSATFKKGILLSQARKTSKVAALKAEAVARAEDAFGLAVIGAAQVKEQAAFALKAQEGTEEKQGDTSQEAPRCQSFPVVENYEGALSSKVSLVTDISISADIYVGFNYDGQKILINGVYNELDVSPVFSKGLVMENLDRLSGHRTYTRTSGGQLTKSGDEEELYDRVKCTIGLVSSAEIKTQNGELTTIQFNPPLPLAPFPQAPFDDLKKIIGSGITFHDITATVEQSSEKSEFSEGESASGSVMISRDDDAIIFKFNFGAGSDLRLAGLFEEMRYTMQDQRIIRIDAKTPILGDSDHLLFPLKAVD